MSFNPKLSPGIQVFRGSRPRQDVFAANSDAGCCDNASEANYDKLAHRTRFDNGLLHSNPLGGIDRFFFPYGDGFQDTRDAILQGINDNGVGYQVSVLAIPTFAWVKGVGIHIESEETGLTFDVVTRNGLVLPNDCKVQVNTDVDGCESTHEQAKGDVDPYNGIGELDDHVYVDYFGRSSGCGEFSLEADEIALKVASMPSSGKVVGEFALTVSVAYEMIHRAEA